MSVDRWNESLDVEAELANYIRIADIDPDGKWVLVELSDPNTKQPIRTVEVRLRPWQPLKEAVQNAWLRMMKA